MLRVAPDFSSLDALYVGTPVPYGHLLAQMYATYEGHRHALFEAYRLRHTSQFRQIKHQMTSLLRLLHCDALLSELERLTEALLTHQSSQVSATQAQKYFDELLGAIKNKQKQFGSDSAQ